MEYVYLLTMCDIIAALKMYTRSRFELKFGN